MVLHWSLSDCKPFLVSRTLQSLMDDLNSAVVRRVFILLLISSSPNYFSGPLGTISSAITTTGVTVSLMFHRFLALRQDLSICLSFCFLLISLYGPLEPQNPQDDFFFLLILRLVFYQGLGNLFVISVYGCKERTKAQLQKQRTRRHVKF